jgi:hypothetical protein
LCLLQSEAADLVVEAAMVAGAMVVEEVAVGAIHLKLPSRELLS